jgi:hypothetical protein
MMRSLNHYTITSGHNRVSPRSEVGDEILRVLAPLLRSGEHQMPGFPGYIVRVTIAQSALAATVYRSGAPIATVIVCPDDAALQDAVRATGAKPTFALTAPAALVEVHPTAGGDTALSWLGDFERCLALAWIERQP